MQGITSLLANVFDIRPTETRRALLLQLYIFILISTLLIVKPTVNSIFLSELSSEALPAAYVITALVAVIFSLFYDRILWAFPLNKVIIGTILLCALLFGLFSFLLNYHPSRTGWLYIPYVFVAIFGLLTTSQFWILANHVFNISEAKRLFGFIGAGAIAGGIFGGYATSILSEVVKSENLLMIAALLLLSCIPISSYLWKTYTHKNKVKKATRLKADTSSFALVRRNPLLTYIALSAGIGVLVAKMVDYQYSHFAAEKITDTEDLTQFFGFWLSTLSVVSLLIQLLLTKRIIKFFGIGKSLIFLPAGILLGTLLFLIIPELWVVVLIKIAEGSQKQSINKAASELAYIPISIELRKHAKPFIDIVVDSIATGLAGVILIFLINGLDVNSFYVSYINIVLIGIWIFLISRIKKSYQEAFRNLLVKIHPQSRKVEDRHLDVHNKSVYQTIERVLHSGSESQILFMLEEILQSPDKQYFKAIRNLLDHPNAEIRRLAIRNLYFLDSEDLTLEMRARLVDSSDEVIVEAMRYFLHKDHEIHRKDVIEFEDGSQHKNIQALTLLAVTLEVDSDPRLRDLLRVGKRVDRLLEASGGAPWDDENRFNVVTALKAIGTTRLISRYPIVVAMLQEADAEVFRAAMESATHIKDYSTLLLIVRRLHDKNLRDSIVNCLPAFGSQAIPVLQGIAERLEVDLPDALMIPEALKAFGSKEAVVALLTLMDTAEFSISVRSIQSLKGMKTDFPNLEIDNDLIAGKILDECRVFENLLTFLYAQVSEHAKDPQTSRLTEVQEAREGMIAILQHRVDAHLARIFDLLGIRYFGQGVDPILKLAKEGDDQQRTNAIEFIDSILEGRLRHTLLPILESLGKGEVYSKEILQKLQVPEISEMECFSRLLKRRDLKTTHAVLFLIEKLGTRKYDDQISPLRNYPIESIRKQATQVLGQN